MGSADLEFFDMEGANRNALLTEAVECLNVLQGHMGGPSGGTDSPQAALLRDLRGDVARFGKFPDVDKITEQTYEARKLEVPVRFKELSEKYNLYCLKFPIALEAKRGWAYNLLKTKIEFNPGDEAAHTKPKAFQILPDRKFQTQFEAGTQLDFGLGENLEFTVKAGPLGARAANAEGRLEASADAKLATKATMIAGPFVYRVKRAKIQHTAPGLETVRWELDGAEFFQEDDFPLVVLAQVPKETKQVKIAAAMQASRYFSFMSADIQVAIEELGKRLRNFFKAGLPIQDTASWDITPAL